MILAEAVSAANVVVERIFGLSRGWQAAALVAVVVAVVVWFVVERASGVVSLLEWLDTHQRRLKRRLETERQHLENVKLRLELEQFRREHGLHDVEVAWELPAKAPRERDRPSRLGWLVRALLATVFGLLAAVTLMLILALPFLQMELTGGEKVATELVLLVAFVVFGVLFAFSLASHAPARAE